MIEIQTEVEKQATNKEDHLKFSRWCVSVWLLNQLATRCPNWCSNFKTQCVLYYSLKYWKCKFKAQLRWLLHAQCWKWHGIALVFISAAKQGQNCDASLVQPQQVLRRRTWNELSSDCSQSRAECFCILLFSVDVLSNQLVCSCNVQVLLNTFPEQRENKTTLCLWCDMSQTHMSQYTACTSFLVGWFVCS